MIKKENRYKKIKERSDISLLEYLHNRGFMQDDSPMKAIVDKVIKDMEAEKYRNEVKP